MASLHQFVGAAQSRNAPPPIATFFGRLVCAPAGVAVMATPNADCSSPRRLICPTLPLELVIRTSLSENSWACHFAKLRPPASSVARQVAIDAAPNSG